MEHAKPIIKAACNVCQMREKTFGVSHWGGSIGDHKNESVVGLDRVVKYQIEAVSRGESRADGAGCQEMKLEVP